MNATAETYVDCVPRLFCCGRDRDLIENPDTFFPWMPRVTLARIHRKPALDATSHTV